MKEKFIWGFPTLNILCVPDIAILIMVFSLAEMLSDNRISDMLFSAINYANP